MAENKRDEMMRIVGQMLAACQLMEQITVPPGALRSMVEVANNAVRKAMLEAWSQAEQSHADGERGS